MKKIAALAFICSLAVMGSGCSTLGHRTLQTKISATKVFLPKDRASHFRSLDGHNASYLELRRDGSYREITRLHLGVGVRITEEGSWTQDASGVVTFVSKARCAHIISSPFVVYVIMRENVKRVPKLRQQIIDFLRKNKTDRFRISDYWEHRWDELFILLEGDHPIRAKLDYLVELRQREFVTREELQKLVSSMDEFVRNPSLQNCKAMPMKYKDRTFLWTLNYGVFSRNLPKICQNIDRSKPGEGFLWCDFLIPEHEFKQEVAKPFPSSPALK